MQNENNNGRIGVYVAFWCGIEKRYDCVHEGMPNLYTYILYIT